MAQKLDAEYVQYTTDDQLWFWGVPNKTPTSHYLNDFGWMGTIHEFC